MIFIATDVLDLALAGYGDVMRPVSRRVAGDDAT